MNMVAVRCVGENDFKIASENFEAIVTAALPALKAEVAEQAKGVETMALMWKLGTDYFGFRAVLDNGTVCGIMKVKIEKQAVCIETLAAHPAGQGIATELIHAAVDLSEAIGKGGRLVLFDDTRGEKKGRVYTNIGFTAIADGREMKFEPSSQYWKDREALRSV